MSNSALANYIDRTNGNYSARPSLGIVTKIMIHNSFSAGDRYTMSELINSGSAGYHYGISTDSVVGLFTDEFRAARGCSNQSINNICIHVLVMPQKDGSMASSVYGLLVDLVEDICRRNYITECTYIPNNPNASTLLEHRWYESTSCPGAFSEKFSSIASTVSNRLKSARKATSSDAIKAQSTISVGGTSPYVATLDPSTTVVDYASLRSMGVVGANFCAGFYYDVSHNQMKTYVNSNLAKQASQALAADMPFSLYCIVRSRNESEARKECSELYYVVSKFPPKLGIWLDLQMTMVSDATAQAIVQVYYDKIVSWGLKGKCGLYCTTAMANKIGWPKWSDRFALWWNAPLSNLNCMENVLTPSLFKLR